MSRPSVVQSVALLLSFVAVLGVLTIPVSALAGAPSHIAPEGLLATAHASASPSGGSSLLDRAPAALAHPAARPAGTQTLGGRIFQTQTTALTAPLQNSYLAVDNATGTVYALADESSEIVAFNAFTGAIERSTTLSNATNTWYPESFAYDNVTGNLYVGWDTDNGDSGAITIVNAATFTIVENLSFADSWIADFYPAQMYFWYATNTLFVENYSTNDLMVLNASNNSWATWVSVPCIGATEYGYCNSYRAMFEMNSSGYGSYAPLLVVPSGSSIAAVVLIQANATDDYMTGGFTDPLANSYLGTGTYDWATQLVYFENATDDGTLLAFNSTGTYVGEAPGFAGIAIELQTDPTTGWILYSQYNFTYQGAQLQGIDPTTGFIGWESYDSTEYQSGYVDTFVTLALGNGTSYAVTEGSEAASNYLLQIPATSVDANLAPILHYAFAPYPADNIQPQADPTTGDFYAVDSDPDQIVAVSESTGATLWSWAIPATYHGEAMTVDAADGIVYLETEPTYGGSDGFLYAFSAASGALDLNDSLAWQPYSIAAGTDHLLYVADSDNDTVQVYNNSGAAGTLTWQSYIQLLVDTDPCWIAASPVAEAVATVACGLTYGVQVATVAAGVPVAYYNATEVAWYGLNFNATGALFIGGYDPANITVLAPGTFAFVENLTASSPVYWIGFLPQIHAIAVSGDGFEDAAETIEVISTVSGHSLGTFAPPAPLDTLGSDGTNGALVGGLTTGQIYLVNLVPAPGAPSGITLMAGNTSLSATWTAATGSSGYPVTGYNVLTSASASGPWTSVGTAPTPTSTLTGLTDGTTYYVTVSATSGAGTGATATPVSGVPAGVPYPPASVSAGAASDSSLAFTWSAPASDDGATVTGYTLLWATNAAGPWTSVPEGTALSATITGLSAGTKYYVKVDATNAHGTGNPTGVLTATTSGSSTTGSSGGLSGNTLLLAAGAIVVLVIILAIVGLLMARRRRSPTPPPGSASPGAPPTGSAPPGAAGGPGAPPAPPPS